MNTKFLRSQLRGNVNHRIIAFLTAPVFLIGGSLVSFLGYVVGVFLALNVGFPPPFEYGGAPGYEGSALLGGMLGAAVASLCLVALWFRKSPLMKRVMAVYACAWFIDVVMQHFAVLATHKLIPGLVVAPVILTGIIAALALWRYDAPGLELGR